MYASHVLGNHPIPMAWGAWPLARHVARSEASAETGGAGGVSQPWDLGLVSIAEPNGGSPKSRMVNCVCAMRPGLGAGAVGQ